VNEHCEEVPVHGPPQRTKVDPCAGVAVSVTFTPSANASVQSEPQSIPGGLLVTEPEPAPVLDTLRARLTSVKVAVTLLAALIDTTQALPEPEQSPLHPAKAECAAGVAVKVTEVPVS
jgi:hypothetical protein